MESSTDPAPTDSKLDFSTMEIREYRFVPPDWAGDGRPWHPVVVGMKLVENELMSRLPIVVTQAMIDDYAYMEEESARLYEGAVERGDHKRLPLKGNGDADTTLVGQLRSVEATHGKIDPQRFLIHPLDKPCTCAALAKKVRGQTRTDERSMLVKVMVAGLGVPKEPHKITDEDIALLRWLHGWAAEATLGVDGDDPRHPASNPSMQLHQAEQLIARLERCYR